MTYTNTEQMILMEENLIYHYLFDFCLLLNWVPLLIRKGEALQSSTLLNVFYHYEILKFAVKIMIMIIIIVIIMIITIIRFI